MDETDVTVRAVDTVGPDTIALELETPDGFEAEPGQFVLVRATVDGEELSRYYTLSSPDVEDTFEITVGVDPDGDLSPWLANRQVGDEITIEGPFGEVYYEGEESVVVFAGGPGVGPAVGLGEAAASAGGDVSIVYRDDEPAHEERLSTLSNGGAHVAIVGDGALDDAVAEVADDGQVYVFGFQAFVEDVRDAIEAAGGDFEAAKVESFG
ncbi:Ferredoxin-NADP reductase [Natronoarchaeum philippinense]|uniref:Ferredoxin-NADP reductase n=1 Tax=Natronoarchaeum philippinense TaxID=558529 RepID=A0A285NTP5_NATPI|nr:FAD-binding oxidoreductase [Natronoarchaeum philippinense]SNZ12840.1 Ferredoxin-NADP reductase [Natronoarchaeum philippinense]